MFRKSKWLKAVGLFLAVAMVAGCSSQPKDTSSQGTAQGNEILIGGNFELSGDVATYGQSTANAIKLAFEEANAKGGVLGKQLKLIDYDNKSDKTESLNIATKLITQDKVVAILGPVTSGNTLAVVPVATQRKIPVISATSTNPEVTLNPATKKVNEYLFRTCFLDSLQGEAAANFALQQGAKKAAIFVSQADEYSKGLAKYFKETYVAGGGEIVAEDGFNKDDNDFRAILTRAKAANPDIIYLPAYYEAAGKIVKQARGLNITTTFLGCDGWDSPKLLEVGGNESLNNCFFTNHYSPEDPDPAVQAFIKAYKEKYNQVPDAFAALSYDAARMLIDAIQKAGSAEPEKIKAALVATKDFPGITGKFSLDENHDPVKSVVVVALTNGKASVKEKLVAK